MSKFTLTIEPTDTNLIDRILGFVWWWELRGVRDEVPWVWKGFARSEKQAERRARRIVQNIHRAEVLKADTRVIELYANEGSA